MGAIHLPLSAFPVGRQLISEGRLRAVSAGLVVAGGDCDQLLRLDRSTDEHRGPARIGGHGGVSLKSAHIRYRAPVVRALYAEVIPARFRSQVLHLPGVRPKAPHDLLRSQTDHSIHDHMAYLR